MVAALHAEWGKTWSLRSSIGCLVAAIIVVVVTVWTLANDFSYDLAHGDRPSSDTMRSVDAVAPALQFGLVVFAAFVMVGVTSEYTGGTIRTTLLAVPQRWPMLAAKATVSATVAALTGFAVVALAGALADAVLQGHLAAGPSTLTTAARAALVIALDAVLVVGVAATLRNSVGTLVASMLLLVATLALPARVSAWTPSGAAGTLLAGDPDVYPAAVGAIVLAGWAVAGGVVGTLGLIRRDA
jgi:ABC-2 type transport system permease protein